MVIDNSVSVVRLAEDDANQHPRGPCVNHCLTVFISKWKSVRGGRYSNIGYLSVFGQQIIEAQVF